MDILKKYYLHFLIGFLFILMVGIYGLYGYEIFHDKTSNKVIDTEPLALANKDEIDSNEDKTMYVEIKGQVVNPGVYAVTSDNIINDVITMAGGLTEYAYTKNINLSKKVSDEMVIVIYSAYEYSTLNKPQIVYVEKPCSCEDVDISSCIQNGSSIIEDGPSSSTSSDNTSTSKDLININTASQSELETLSGIGEAKAQAIIKYRTEKGSFKTIEDIINVDGISQTLFDKIKDYITV